MKHRKPQDYSSNGHVVSVYDKTRLIERKEYPTYGKAMHGVIDLEIQYPHFRVEYRDTRVFRTDTYE
jgi:hypothetical protein